MFCLSMIFRNEAQTIRRAIDSVRPWLSAFEISDTGSDDASADIARSALAGLPGKIAQDEWKDFSHNRNQTLRRAQKHALPVILVDCDDVVSRSGGEIEKDWDLLTVWAYDGTLRHRRVLSVQPALGAIWRGHIHEQISVPLHSPAKSVHTNAFTVRYLHDGNRARNKASTYTNDVGVLEEMLLDKVSSIHAQYYLARTHHHARKVNLAIQAYEAFLAANESESDERTFHAIWSLAALYEAENRSSASILKCLGEAITIRPSRVEALLMSARIQREIGEYDLAFECCAKALAAVSHSTGCNDYSLTIPDDDFVDTSYYGWRLFDELATTSIYTGRISLGYDSIMKALGCIDLPSHARDRLLNNLANIDAPKKTPSSETHSA
jgi:tetratricopeptide (TPR) repeat protein